MVHDRAVQGWRAELEELVARGRASVGHDEVRAALSDALENLVDRPVRLTPSVPVLGLSSCDAGWLGVLLRPDGLTSLHLGSSIVGVVEQVREHESLGAVGLAGTGGEDAAAWLATRPTVQVVEVAELDGTPEVRRDRLMTAGLAIPPMFAGLGFAESDLLAACEAAVAAAHL